MPEDGNNSLSGETEMVGSGDGPLPLNAYAAKSLMEEVHGSGCIGGSECLTSRSSHKVGLWMMTGVPYRKRGIEPRLHKLYYPV